MSELFGEYAMMHLAAKKRRGNQWADFRCRAPGHDDRSASCSINLDDGRVRCQAAHCNFDGWIDQYATECGLPMPPDKPGWCDGKPIKPEEAEKFKASTPLATYAAKPAASYVYRDMFGKPHMKVDRLSKPDGGKSYPQSRWTGAAWELGLSADFARILYRVNEVAKSRDPIVIVTEGEKNADCAWDLGFTATTASGGAGNAHKTRDWTALAGKDVVIIQDNDQAGRDHARQVAAMLLGIARSIRIETMPDVPEKGDLSDWVEAGGTAEGLREIIAASPAWGLPVTKPPEKTPEKSRTYTERSYIWASLGDKPTAQILSGFGEKRWRDRESRDAAAALKAILARDEEPTQYNLSQELAAGGKFSTFETLVEFCAKWITDDIHRPEAYRAFRDACDWDDFGAMLTAEVAQLNQGTCNKAASRLLDKVSAFVGTAKAVQKPKTLKQVVLDRLDEIESEDPDEKNIRLRLVDKYTGPFGGGDAVYGCGPPKTGKTGLLMQMLRDAAQDGYTSLLGQLELREQQIADREGSYILGKPLPAFTAAERRYLRESNALANHERILVTPKFTDLEAYRSYVTMAFAQNKDIRIWATDYSEMVQDFGTKADQLAQTEAVSDFVKKTATAFDVLGILFTQPKEEYFKDCAHENRPRLTHWKRGRKYQQDAQALFFLHNPHEFDKSKPDNYLELYLQLCRSAPPAMIPLMVERSSFIYTEWKGDLPGGGGSTGNGKNHGGSQHAGRPIDIAAKIRQQAKSMSFEDLDGTPDIDLSGILGV